MGAVSRSGLVVSEEATLSKMETSTTAATTIILAREMQLDMPFKTSMMPQVKWKTARALREILALLGVETWPEISLRETTRMQG